VSGAVRLEKLGIPVVLGVAKGFEHDADEACYINRMPNLRKVVIPGYIWGRQPREAKKPLAEENFDRLIDELLRPLTQEEKNPVMREEEFRPVLFTGKSYEEVLEKYNQYFLDNRWGDGLPLVPPTDERVRWMLSGTKRSPDETIGPVSPGNSVATIEKIAVNAVMAGAKPEYLPVIVAAMEGLTDRDFDLLHVQASTGNFTLAVIVSGPIAEEINMNSGIGYLGHGWRANNTIGRAVRLCLTNLGRVWPGVSDMANIGRPSPHTFYTFAENSKLSPWEPYHTGRGFKAEDSCVTVSTVGGYGGYAVNHLTGFKGKDIIENLVEGIGKSRSIFGSFRRGTANPFAHWSKHIIILYPLMADQLNEMGYTQEKLENEIYERTRIPYDDLTNDEIKGLEDRIQGSVDRDMLYADTIPPDGMSVFAEAMKPGGKVPVLISPKDLNFIVAGSGAGVPGLVVWLSYIKAVYRWTSHQVKCINGALLTKAGR
jgi:hypothetical protein